MQRIIITTSIVLIYAFAAFAQAPQVVSVSPAQNEVSAAITSNITVTFDMFIHPGSINDSTFVVHSRFFGLLGGNLTYNNNTLTSTFDPDEDFMVGDYISVVLTTGITSPGGIPMSNSYGWSFTIQALPPDGPAFFLNQICPVNGNPWAITTADFDQDGDIDLATANFVGDNVKILFNNGYGIITGQYYFHCGNGPNSIFSADLDNDGDVDIAVANRLDDNIVVARNGGNGRSWYGNGYLVGNDPRTITGSDLNGDGYTDLLITNYYSNDVYILFNDGTGLFQNRIILPALEDVWAIAGADLDSDGDPDLAYAARYDYLVSIRMNNGDGTFGVEAIYPTDNGPIHMIPRDVDLDYDLDLIMAINGRGTVSIMPNQGNGTFPVHIDYPVGGRVYNVNPADLDGDGDLDIITTHNLYDFVSIVDNVHGVQYDVLEYIAVGEHPKESVAADYDNDGDLDFAVATSPFNTVQVFLQEIPGGISGTVYSEFSELVEGAIVEAVETGKSDTTERSGLYFLELSSGIYDLVIQKSGYYDVTVLDVVVESGITITIDVVLFEVPGACTGCIQGTVINAELAPIGSVYVYAFGTWIDDYTYLNGEFSLEGLSAGTYDISFSHDDYKDSILTNIVVTDTQMTPLNLILESNCAIRGIVADTGSQPLGNTIVNIVGKYISDTTDVNGEFFIHGIVHDFEYDLSFKQFLYYDQIISDVAVPANETLILDTVYMEPLPLDVIVWYGNPDGSPVTAPINGTILIDLYCRTADSVDIGFLHLPLATDDQYIVAHHSESLGVLYYTLAEWDTVYFLPPDDYGPGWHSQSILGFYDIGGGPNPPLQCNEPTRIASFAFQTANDSSLIGDTVYCLTEGFNPANGGPLFGDIDGITAYYPVQYFSPLYFSDEAGICIYTVGDANRSWSYNGLDITYGVAFFKGGPPPPYECECTVGNTWYVAGDVNASCNYNGLDITYGVAYFKGGPAPQPCPDCPPAQ
ncbi:MAG: VCBS repeat-containing protein [Candidatus Zixiibacteriota bacterium]|nr:MAG: VCBS repeat-containing protein [candidate division Zixibacteria bacterium]